MIDSLLSALLLSALVVGADERVDRLPLEHKTWLQRDVVYIITDREREVFLTLEALEERNHFIEAFWRKRDPNLTTPVNEFKEEHYSRLEYANKFLGRDTYREGWNTDRGRYFIILGEPNEIQRFDGYGNLVGSHLWLYQGDPNRGLPAFFYLLFFRDGDIGDYRLYSPMIDGPQKLLTGRLADTDRLSALDALDEISSELAAASLSFDTSEPPDLFNAQPAIGADLMIARIENSPKRAIRTDYADIGLRFRNRVSSEYTFNFVPSQNQFSLLVHPSGTSIVQYSIEIDPQNFATESDEDKMVFYTTLDLVVQARTPDGVLALTNEREVYIELSPSRMIEVQSRPFAYQDQFALVPGDYTVSVILKNRVLHQYAVAETELNVPEFSPAKPELTDVILAFDTEVVADAAEGAIRTFQVGDLKIQPASGGFFVIGETVHVVSQAFGASSDHKVQFELVNAAEVLQSFTSPVDANGTISDQMTLNDLVGGTYDVRARLLSPGGEIVSEKSTPITVSPRSSVRRPGFVYRRGFDTELPGLLNAMRGEQLWNLGQHAASTRALEQAVAENPRHVPARIMLATIYLRGERAEDALKLLDPLEDVLPKQYEVISGIGIAKYILGDYDKAVGYLERARTLRSLDTLLLNALADSYHRLGNYDKTREIYERSLGLNANQDEVRQRLATLGDGQAKN